MWQGKSAKTAGLVLLAVSTLWAQGEAVNARLGGTVLDPAQAVVPAATVTLSNPDTGFRRQFITGNEGQYTFTLIPPGRYELRVEKEGFSTYVQSNVVLAVGQISTVNPTLALASAPQLIEVTGDSPILNTGNANIACEVSGKQVVELPLNVRNVFGLVNLSSSVNNANEQQALN